jgi:hypothetical protein
MEKSLSYRQKALSGVERIVAGTPSSTISRGLNPCELTRSMKGDAPAGVSTRRFRDKEIATRGQVLGPVRVMVIRPSTAPPARRGWR